VVINQLTMRLKAIKTDEVKCAIRLHLLMPMFFYFCSMLEVDNISFSYTDKRVIENVSFSLSKGQHLSIIGESGCGKSTLLKLIYGLYDLDEGRIFYNDKPILGPKFNLIRGEDNIKYLAQDFGLMPFITVAENVGKFLSNIYKDQKKQRISELLEMVEMTEFADTKAQFLSGGQQQRVALAKSLALEPEVLLLDEPFSQVDVFRANRLRRNLYAYLKEKEIICIVATHDSSDVLSFSDETIVMQHGIVVAKDDPINLYKNPTSKYAASLFGDVNEIPEHLLKTNGNASKMILVYPHQLKITDRSSLSVTVLKSYFKGNVYLTEGMCANGKIYFEHPSPLPKQTMVYLKVE